MAIPESQLETWSHQGSITQSKDTYQRIRNVLTEASNPYAGKSYSVFLQGSYGNDTNIYAESDVDIVIKLEDCYQSGLDDLPTEDHDAYNRAFMAATYTNVEFKKDVLEVLATAFGGDVSVGAKAIAIKANGNRRKADVIPAIHYRRYYKFRSTSDQSFIDGICFYTVTGQMIANYPKQHSANLTTKHQATNQWLKPMVRILKNMRSSLVENGSLKYDIAPSYFIEGLLYNVPKDKFGGTYGDSFVKAINWLQQEADKEKLSCANEQYYLLRDNDHNCWPKANEEAFLAAVIDLWNNW